jgi:hypothetical protein
VFQSQKSWQVHLCRNPSPTPLCIVLVVTPASVAGRLYLTSFCNNSIYSVLSTAMQTPLNSVLSSFPQTTPSSNATMTPEQQVAEMERIISYTFNDRHLAVESLYHGGLPIHFDSDWITPQRNERLAIMGDSFSTRCSSASGLRM